MQNKNRGAAMVEFAIVVPFFFMLMLSIVYGALVMHDINSLNEITRNATRYGAVIDSGVSDGDKRTAVVDFVKNKANKSLFLYKVKNSTDVNIVDSEISVSAGGSNQDNAVKDKSIKITVQAEMDTAGMPSLFMDYFPKDLQKITSTLTMRKED